ncbi:MAG: 1,4-dihydroxy-6-naphthoate synthase [Sphingobacteriales bacterium JAD_PAG50586_3]|nr:MAG: 1,4-dihydroxy-6-naphthoate synthase [Sphingobacteriales bacterium JAD_PAG50586_3]
MKLTLGFSPCPNDTFIFDALVNKKIDTQGIDFEVVYADVEQLNRWAMEGKLDITKLSFHAYAYCIQNYVLLNSGSALGNNCGPMLIARSPLQKEDIETSRIAIPGKMTTANFLLGVLYPKANNKEEKIFSGIEGAVADGSVDMGLIIHENRFTYQKKGLFKVTDLGEEWETKTHSPIPLGGIFIKRAIDSDVQHKVDALIRQSIEYAFANPESSRSYVKEHSQEMEDSVIEQHINLYVNKYSINLGEEGKQAVETLFEIGKMNRIIPENNLQLFM